MKITYSKKWKRLKIVTIALILLCACSLTALVTYAASTHQEITMGGNVTFTAVGVNATVTPGTKSNLTMTTPDTLVYSTATANSGNASTWEDLTISVSASPATFTFNIANTATTGSLALGITVDQGTTSNMTIAPSLTSATIAAGSNQDITITFTLTDSTKNGSATGFSIKITLEAESKVTSASSAGEVVSAIEIASITDANANEIISYFTASQSATEVDYSPTEEETAVLDSGLYAIDDIDDLVAGVVETQDFTISYDLDDNYNYYTFLSYDDSNGELNFPITIRFYTPDWTAMDAVVAIRFNGSSETWELCDSSFSSSYVDVSLNYVTTMLILIPVTLG